MGFDPSRPALRDKGAGPGIEGNRMKRLLWLVLLAGMLPATSLAWWQEAPPRPGDRRPRTFERRIPGPGRGSASLTTGRAPLPPPWLLERMMDVPAEEQQQMLENDPRFQELPPERQEFLRESLRRFQELPPERREELLGRVRRFQQMPPERRRELLDRQRRFRELPQEERERIEQRFDAFRRLSPEQRERAREIYSRQWRSLPPERRRALLDEFRRLRALPSAERERRLARPDIAEHFNAEERELLRELSTL